METTPLDTMAAPPLTEGGTTSYRELNRDKTRLPRWMDDVMHRKPRWASDAYNDEPASVTEGVRTQRARHAAVFEELRRQVRVHSPQLSKLLGKVWLGEDELVSVINKANPEVENNKDITAEDFLALMAQAEYSAMFLEAFALLDPYGHGWVESEQLWAMMASLVPADDDAGGAGLGAKVDELIETFGVSDGHIDYQAFVKIMIEGTGDAAPRPAA